MEWSESGERGAPGAEGRTPWGIIPKDAKQSIFVGGPAAPPQLDLLINSGYHKDRKFTSP